VLLQLDRLGHARGGDVTGRIRENLYDRKLLQQKLGHLQVWPGTSLSTHVQGHSSQTCAWLHVLISGLWYTAGVYDGNGIVGVGGTLGRFCVNSAPPPANHVVVAAAVAVWQSRVVLPRCAASAHSPCGTRAT
jgi:hypothetical protein